MSRLSFPVIQLLDSSGATAGSGTLTFYAQGTTTLQDTYSDAARTLPNKNPITVNGSGLSGTIYLQYLDYTILAQDADGKTLWTDDFDGRWLADGSDYTQGFTGSAARTVQSRLAEYVSVKDFGATGDGVTDDSANIQAAIDATGGIDLFFPTGTYIVDGLTSAVSSKFVLEPGATLKHKSSSSAAMLISSNDLEIQGGTIDGNKAGQTNRVLLVQHSGSSLQVDRVNFQNSVKAAIEITTCSGICSITNNRFTGMEEHGGVAGEITMAIHIKATTAAVVRIDGNEFIGATPSATGKAPGGIHCPSAAGGSASRLRITNNYFYRLGQAHSGNLIGAIDLYTDADESVVSNNTLIESFFAPIKIQNAANITCAGNVISGLTSSGQAEAAISWQYARTIGVQISNCAIIGNTIDISGNTTNACIDVRGDSAGTYLQDQGVVSGNVCVGGLNGIRAGFFDHISIIGNTLSGMTNRGIDLDDLGDFGGFVLIGQNNFDNIGSIHIVSRTADNNNNLNISVIGNLLDGTSGTPDFFVQVTGASGAMVERVTFANNTAIGTAASADFQVTWADSVVITGNHSDGDTVAFSNSNNTAVREVGNSWQTIQTYSATNVSTDRAFDADTVAIAELADVVGTLISDLRAQGMLL